MKSADQGKETEMAPYLGVKLVHFLAHHAELIVKLPALEKPRVGAVHVRDKSLRLTLKRQLGYKVLIQHYALRICGVRFQDFVGSFSKLLYCI